MIHIVAGLHRSGTSMMMRAIHLSSDLPLYMDWDVEQIIRDREQAEDGYDPNPHGYFSTPWLEGGEYPKGVLLKLHTSYLSLLAEGDYRVIVMLRDDAEREASWHASFGMPEETIFNDPDHGGLDAALARNDMQVTPVQYSEAVGRPQNTFKALAESGWPLDPYKAAATVEPALYRHR